MSIFNKINYLEFEHYCVKKHIETFGHETYHWHHISDKILIDSGYIKDEEELRLKRKNNKGILREFGIDAISIFTKDNGDKIYNPLQMKLWDNKQTICANKLGTFILCYLCGFLKKNSESKGYLYHTSKLEHTLQKYINDDTQIISIYVDNPFINKLNNTIDNNIILRPYQLEAIENLNKNWDGVGSLIMPCGTGKTIVFCEFLKYNQPKNIIVINPLKLLTEQNLSILERCLPDYESLLFDSNGTTNFNDVLNLLNKNKKCIISTTYISAQQKLKLLFENNNNFNTEDTILIVEEAHNLLNNNELIIFIKKFSKVLLVTATPPIKMEDILPSKNIYTYSLNEAIKNKYICDYQIYLPFIENKESIINVPENLFVIDENIMKKCLFFINGLMRTGSIRTIVYLKNISECNIYKGTIKEIMSNYHSYNVEIYEIINETKKEDRIKILKQFEEDNEEEIKKIILSVRILDEGIDIPKCDSIFITNIGEVDNDIRNTQRMLRANRLDKNNPNKIANIFIWCDDTNKGLNTLQLLRSNDINFNRKIRINNDNYGEYKKDTKISEYIMNKNNEFINFIDINCLNDEEIWEKKRKLLFKFCNNNNRIINEEEKEGKHTIGNWYYSQIIKLKNNIELYKNIYNKLIQNYYVKEHLNNILELSNNIKTFNTKYICKKCSYETYMLKDLFKHIRKKNECGTKNNYIEYSEDQLLVLTLLPYNNDKHIIEVNEIQYLKDSTILTKHKNEFLDVIDSIYKNKMKICKFCSKNFNTITDLRKHTIISCFYNEIKNRNELTNDIDKKSTSYEYCLQIEKPVPFDNNWDISKINSDTKMLIVFNKLMYTRLLEEILENDSNLNVIIDKDSSSGIVFLNDVDEYIEMKKKDIINITMEKLKNQLLQINNDIEEENITLKEINDYFRKIITKKFIDYTKDKNIQDQVVNCMSNIFNEKKDNALSLSKKITKQQKNNEVKVI